MAKRRLEYDIVTDTSKFSKGIDKSSRELGRLGSAGDKTFGQLKRGAGIAAAGLTGGLVVGLKMAADAAIEAEKTQARLEAQLKASNISYREYATQIETVIAKQSALSGLDDEDLTDSFTNLVRVTGDVNEALKLNALAADLSRAKGIEVAKAAVVIGKAYDGNTGALKKYGVEVEKGATAQEVLANAQRTFAGQAEAYGNTTAGSLDKMKVAGENLAETVGTALAPKIAAVADDVSKFVTEMQTGEGAGGRFADSLGKIADKVASIVQFFKDHPQLIAVAAGAWVTYKVASLAALAAINVKKFRAAFGAGKVVAGVEGATAGGAYAASFNTASSAGISAGGVAKAGFFSRIFRGWGKGWGIAAAGGLLYEFNEEITAGINKILNDVLPDSIEPGIQFQGTAGELQKTQEALKNAGKVNQKVKDVASKARPKAKAGAVARSSAMPKDSTSRTHARDLGSGNEGSGPAGRRSRGSSGGRVTGDAAGLNAELMKRLRAMSAGTGQPISITSGRRSYQEQVQLVAQKGLYGPNNRQGAAAPGTSNHESGLAADISPGQAVFGNVAAAYGLAFNVPGEPWHIEAVGVASSGGGGTTGGGAAGISFGSVAASTTPKQSYTIVGSSTRGSGGLGGRRTGSRHPQLDDPEQFAASLDIAEAQAGTDRGALARITAQRISAARLRLAKIDKALKGRLRPETRTRLLREKATLIGELAELGTKYNDLTGPVPVEAADTAAADTSAADMAAAMNALTAEIKSLRADAAASMNLQGVEAMRWVADQLSGHIAGRYQQRARTPGNADLAIYQ